MSSGRCRPLLDSKAVEPELDIVALVERKQLGQLRVHQQMTAAALSPARQPHLAAWVRKMGVVRMVCLY
jgi:hypothetical protein